MTISWLVENVSQELNVSKVEARKLIDTVLEQIVEITIVDRNECSTPIGKFYFKKRNARKGRNPQTQEVINIPEKFTMTFKPNSELSKRLNS